MLKCKCPLAVWLTDELTVILACLNLNAFHSGRTHTCLANLQPQNDLTIDLRFTMNDTIM